MALVLNGRTIARSFGTTTVQSTVSTVTLPAGDNRLEVQLLNWRTSSPVTFVVTDAVVAILKPQEGDRILLNQPQIISIKAFSVAEPRSGSLLTEQGDIDWPIERVSEELQASGQIVTEYRWTTNEARLRTVLGEAAPSAVAAQFQLVITTGQARRRAEGQTVLTPSIAISLVDEELYDVRLSIVGIDATVECLHYGPSAATFQVSMRYNGLAEQVVVLSLSGSQTSTFQLDLSSYAANERVELVAACESTRDASVWRSSEPSTITVPETTSQSRGASKASCSGLECGGALAGLIVGLLILLAIVVLAIILLRRRQEKFPDTLPPPTIEQNGPDTDLYRWKAEQQQHQHQDHSADVDKQRTMLAMNNPMYSSTAPTPAQLTRQASVVSEVSDTNLTDFQANYYSVDPEDDPRLSGGLSGGGRTFSTSHA
jgi:hypothetical protein